MTWTLGTLAIALGLIQLVPVQRTNPPIESEVPAPGDVRAVLRRACYDCHSHETTWPWYSRIAPISWKIAEDVHEGRAALNFSTWNRLDTKHQVEAMHHAWEEVAEEEMPPWFYLPPHPTARLSPDDRSLLRAWAMSVRAEDSAESDED